MTTPLPLPDRPITWVTAGDSITAGMAHTHGRRSWAEHLKERLWQRDRGHDLVINTGVSGWRVPDLAGDLDVRVLRFRPDVVVLSLGTNDSTGGDEGVEAFADGLAELGRRILGAGSTLVLATPVVQCGSPEHQSLPAYAEAVRGVAARLEVRLVDHEADWRSVWREQAPLAWLNDAIHPNERGHRRMADHLLRTLGLGPLQPGTGSAVPSVPPAQP